MTKHAALPSPADLGFPDKFADWYPDQIEAIDRAVFNKRRFTALNMPTGSGKSVTGIATALLHAGVKRAVYLTSTKGLQDQLASDFQSLGLFDLRGAKNYGCRAVEPGEHLDRYRRSRYTIGCDEGPCHSGVTCDFGPIRVGNTIPLRPDCAYYGARWDARRAPIVSTNYAMYLASEEYAEGLGPVDMLILDEAHDADKELEAFLKIELTIDDIKFLGSKMLKSGSLSDWRDWAVHHKGPLASKLEQRQTFPIEDSEGMRELRTMKRVKAVLDRIADIVPLDWVMDMDPMRVQFSPMRIAAYAEKYLFRNVKHVVLMSATMTPKTLTLLGIDRDEAMFWECPHRFPVEHRPIISVNTWPPVQVNARMHESTKALWLTRIDQIIGPRVELGWNGIIHTVSYQRMRELVALSDYRDHFIVHDSTNTRDQIAFFKSRPNTGKILVSPSVVTGYDFPDDECRFQIIGKVPLPDMRGPIMSIRKELDKSYSGYLAMQKLVQACGRGVRGPLDRCETFIVEDTFADWFMKANWKHAPRWFKDAIYYLEHIPTPLELVA